MLMLFLSAFVPNKAFAQFPYSESFMNATAAGTNFGGSPAAYLTSGNPDPSGNGYLRLTSNAGSQRGYAFNSSSFPASKGISVSFEYYTYGGNGADGICFFLFDAAVADASFAIGAYGGSLGYSANAPSTAGLSKAYLGIGLDEFGNFSNAAFGAGGTGAAPNSVTIRGAWDDSRGAYYMLKTVPVQTNFNFPIGSGSARVPTAGTAGYRKAFIDILPHAGGGFDITVKIQHDAVSSPVTVVNNYYYNYASPANLKFGFAASTGGSNNYHEIRNTSVSLPAGTTLATPTQTNQTITTCSNSTGSVNISSGFSTTNSPNGAINTASVDLDPTTSGIQTTYTVASKGTFTSDGSGNITFTPLNSTVAGTASCNFTVADNYGATSNTATVTATINPVPTTANAGPNQTINAAIPATVSLNGNSPTAGTGNWSQISGPSTAAFANAALPNTNVSNLNPGTYVFRWTITNSCGTSTSNVTITVTGTQTITFASFPAKTYGDADFNAGATATSGLAVGYTSSNPAVATVNSSGLVHILSAGTATITASQPGNGSYSAATAVQQILTVNKASLTATADNQSKTYGSANPALTVSYSGFVNGDTQPGLTTPVTISTTATASSAVGTYPIMASGAAAANYTIAYANGNLSVYPGIQTISFNAQPKTYGDPDFALTASASSGLPVVYSSSNPTVATVDAQGTVHIVSAGNVIITASQPGNGNYIATTNINQQLVINKTPLAITADNQTSTYGSAIPALTVSYTGFVNGDTEANLTTPPSATTTATTSSPVGIYPVTVSGAASSSYIITYQPGTLTIAPNTQTVTFAAMPAKTYGDADFNLSASASSGSAVTFSSSDPTVATVDAAGRVHILSAGTVIITSSQAGNSNVQAAPDVQQTLTVNQAPLSLTADNETITYGSATPALTITYSGFINGDTPASLSTAPVVATTATAASAAGTYPITVAGAASVNYAITYQDGTFTVLPGAQSITFPALTAKNYGDADFTIDATSSNTSVPITYASSNPAVATVDAAGKVHILSAGTTTITSTQAGNGNYSAAASVSQVLTVNKAALTITANNQSSTYGSAVPAFTLSYSGFVNGDDATSLTTQPTVNTVANATSAAGVYAITVNGAASANYNITYVAGTFTIANPTISSVSLAQATVFENQPAGTSAGTLNATSPDPNATYTYSLVSGNGSTDNASFSIQGNKLVTTKSLDFEQKSIYSILVRATNQYGSYLDQILNINLSDVNEAPTLAAIANQQICSATAAQTIALNGITPGPETAQNTALSVSSNNPGLFTNLNVSSVTGGAATLTYQLAGTGTAIITVTAKDNGGTANGGTDSFSQTFTVTANGLPVAAITSDKGLQITKGEILTLTATGGGTYSWDTAPNIGGTSSSAVVQFRPSQTTTYQVTVSNASGCSSTSSITIDVKDDYASIQPTNILTPNGDGKNDTWVVKNIDLYPNNTVSIFDKGGRLLKKVSRYNNDWDGTYNGSPLAEGTYYYVIDFGTGKALIKGFITILRNR